MIPDHGALLDDLYDELRRGRIYECSLRDPEDGVVLEGLQSGQDIYIDPRPAILEVLLHELLHRRKPRWSERRVTLIAKHLVNGMDEPTRRTWWQRYRRVKKAGPPVDI